MSLMAEEQADRPPGGDRRGQGGFSVGTVVQEKYRIQGALGKGSFGIVLLAQRLDSSEQVAIKVIRDHPSFTKLALGEIEMMEYLNEQDPDDCANIVRVLDSFVHEKRQCIVTQLYSYSLLDVLDRTDYRGVSLNLVRRIAQQLLQSLEFLGAQHVIHCDLKPENVLLVSPDKSQLKLIDFGSACHSSKLLFSYVQSRFYRAPEIVLGLFPYTCAIDMWSLGCLLAEMHTGVPLFPGDDEEELLGYFERVLGSIPNNVLSRATKARRIEGSVPVEAVGLEELLEDEDLRRRYPHDLLGHSVRDYEAFESLLRGMLAYDPLHRLSPSQALQHEFFSG